MLHRIVLTFSTLSMLTFVTCAGQNKTPKSSKNDKVNSTTTKTSTEKSNQDVSVKSVPEAEKSTELKIVPPEKTSTMSNETEMITFREGENKFLKAYDMNVTFKKITQDSRCPEGVNCIWEGAATAEIEFMGTYTRPVTVQLSTLNNSSKNLTKDAVFNKHKISLVKVTPYPTSKNSSSNLKGKYQITLQFVKITENQIENSTR